MPNVPRHPTLADRRHLADRHRAHVLGLHVAHYPDAPQRSTGAPALHVPELLSYPAGVGQDEVQGYEDGAGPLFHRCYRTRIRDSTLSADELMGKVQSDPNRTSPTKFARFQLTRGRAREPPRRRRVRRADAGTVGRSGARHRRRPAILSAGHSGRASGGGPDRVPGPPRRRPARVRDRVLGAQQQPLVNLLYHRLRMAKEVQAHMWISFLERVVDLPGDA